MKLKDTIQTALVGLKRNRLRSGLTTLGIIIGVGSVVLMVSVGASFEAYIFGQLEAISAGTIDIYPKGMEKFGGQLDTISFEDGEAIARLSTLEDVAPAIFVTEKIRYKGEEESPFILGSLPGFFINYGMTAKQGRLLTMEDDKAARPVVVIGPELAEDLFPGENALGKRVTVGNRKLMVVGITKEMGSLTGQDLDKMATMPLSVAKSITGQQYLSYITVHAVTSTDLAIADIKSTLRQRHGISNPEDDPDKDDFLARSAEQATEILGTVTSSLTLFLGLIAGISLLVGGIGIMNIMLVSVTERTKEIGLRKAVGAKRRDILVQFLLEASALTSIGGAIGIIGGLTLAFLMAAVANKLLGDFPFALSWGGMALSVCMAVGVGLLFGIYPAKKAASLSPMQAIRWD